jgi:hypothetical protein
MLGYHVTINFSRSELNSLSEIIDDLSDSDKFNLPDMPSVMDLDLRKFVMN